MSNRHLDRGNKRRIRILKRGAERLTLALAALLLATGIAAAEMVEVAPGVQVTKTAYKAPADEQPFYGFSAKSAEQRGADARFIAEATEAAGSRQQAFDALTMRGWSAILKGRTGEAAKRFNQAFLLSPEQSSVYHGFAMIAQMRFNDLAFAEELFKVALKQPHPLKMLNADYGRILLMAKRPRDARPVLEQAVLDRPDFGDAWVHLAYARLKSDDRSGACAAANEAANRGPSRSTIRDLVHLKKDAQCN